MIVSPNELIGSIVYRTREALNGNHSYMQGIRKYKYYPAITNDSGKLQLWHYAGTFEEISEKYVRMNDIESCRLKFPAIFNYQAVTEDVQNTGLRTLTYNLAFIAPVDPLWGTETREANVWNPVLSGIYAEFLRQIKMSGAFSLPVGEIPHRLHRIPTTGRSAGESVKCIYADYMDAFQISGLRLNVGFICEKDLMQIHEENRKVSEITN
jgi:hypothetical protein